MWYRAGEMKLKLNLDRIERDHVALVIRLLGLLKLNLDRIESRFRACVVLACLRVKIEP